MSEGLFPIAFTPRGQHDIQNDRRTRRSSDELRTVSRYGKIVRITMPYNEDGDKRYIRAYIRFDDALSAVSQESVDKPFILGYAVEEIAMIYGDDLIGLRCRVDFIGANSNQGIVTIISDTGEGDLEEANKLRDFGTLLAPAGSGL